MSSGRGGAQGVLLIESEGGEMAPSETDELSNLLTAANATIDELLAADLSSSNVNLVEAAQAISRALVALGWLDVA